MNAQPAPRRSDRCQHADDRHRQHDDRQNHGALALQHVAFDHLFERDRAEQSDQQPIAIGAKRRADADLTANPTTLIITTITARPTRRIMPPRPSLGD